MNISKRTLLTGAGATALALPVAGCFTTGGTIGVDPKTVSLLDAVMAALRSGFCATLLPTLDTVAQFVLAAALPAALPIEQAAALVAKQICDKLTPLVQARQGKLTAERRTGKPVIDYGDIILENGKVIKHVSVYT